MDNMLPSSQVPPVCFVIVEKGRGRKVLKREGKKQNRIEPYSNQYFPHEHHISTYQ